MRYLISILLVLGTSSGTPALAQLRAYSAKPLGEAMIYDLGIPRAKVALALGAVTNCGRSGGIEMSSLSAAIPEIAPYWRRAFSNPDPDAHVSYGGVQEVWRLCMALQDARRSTPDDASAVAEVITVLNGTSDAAKQARVLMRSRELPSGIPSR